MNKPPFDHRILRPFKYIPAAATDISPRVEMFLRKQRAKVKQPAKPTNVQPLRKKERQAA